MAFKIRDLMISVLPTAVEVPGCINCTGTTPRGCVDCTGTTPRGCVAGTGDGCPNCSGTTNLYIGFGCPNCSGTTGDAAALGCHHYSGGCPNCTGTTGGFCAHAAALMACGLCTGVSPLLADQRPQALALLRQQLQGLLSEVEAEEQRIGEAAFPQSVEEAEALETKLEEALAEVRSRKAGLGKNTGLGKKTGRGKKKG
jgi:hypothetical protein